MKFLGVEEYFLKLPPAKREVALNVHQFLLSYTNVYPTLKYNIPFYCKNKWLAYINVPKNKNVELVFVRAREYPDEIKKLVDFKNRTMVASIELTSIHNLDYETIHKVFTCALALDDLK